MVEVRFMKMINVTAMARFGTKSWPIVGWMSSAVNEMSDYESEGLAPIPTLYLHYTIHQQGTQ